MKTTVTRSKAEQAKNSCTLKITGLTQGEMIALVNALALRSAESPVCADVFQSVREAMEPAWSKVAQESITPEEVAGTPTRKDLADILTKLGRTAAEARGVRFTGTICSGDGIEEDILACTEAMKRERATKG